MEDTYQWLVALLIGLPVSVLLAWFNKSGSDFNDGFEQKKEKKKMNYQLLLECYSSG